MSWDNIIQVASSSKFAAGLANYDETLPIINSVGVPIEINQ